MAKLVQRVQRWSIVDLKDLCEEAGSELSNCYCVSLHLAEGDYCLNETSHSSQVSGPVQRDQ